MGPKKAKKGGAAQSPGEDVKAGEKMSELDKEWYLIQIKSLGRYFIQIKSPGSYLIQIKSLGSYLNQIKSLGRYCTSSRSRV
jgi:hypothetical protein